MRLQFHSSQFVIGDLDFGFVLMGIDVGFHDETPASLGTGNQVDDSLNADEGFSAPVLCNDWSFAFLKINRGCCWLRGIRCV